MAGAAVGPGRGLGRAGSGGAGPFGCRGRSPRSHVTIACDKGEAVRLTAVDFSTATKIYFLDIYFKGREFM